MNHLLPLFLDVAGRPVLLVGGGPVAAGKLRQLLAARADVRVVAPEPCEAIAHSGIPIVRRRFEPADLEGVWLVVAAATPEANREVAAAAEARRVFVNAVDDPANATAFMSGVVRRGEATIAISTNGTAPALAGLLREAIDAVIPRDLNLWLDEARRQRIGWRRRGVRMEKRRPLLLEALNKLYASGQEPVGSELPDPGPAVPGRVAAASAHHTDERATAGRVSLVGAGPGDPGLLTRRGVARLRAADLVLYDALIDPRTLKLARRAQRFFVGKRAGRQAMTQHAINTVMIRAARRGKRVVRLKGGDPFVFGRGGEEVAALRAAGVDVDVVPGITSAIAAPALSGIPVTYRGLSSAFLVVGGHDRQAFNAAVKDVAPNRCTIVVLMGVAHRSDLAAQLLDLGWAADTPAAIIVDASRVTQTTWRGTLHELAFDGADLENDGPGTIVVGEVVALGDVEDVSERESRGTTYGSR